VAAPERDDPPGIFHRPEFLEGAGEEDPWFFDMTHNHQTDEIPFLVATGKAGEVVLLQPQPV